MPSIIISFAPGIEAAVSLPPSGRTSGSTVPWITSVGAFTDAQSFLAAAGGQHRAQLPSDAGRIEPALKGAFGALAVLGFVERETADAQHFPGLREADEKFVLGFRRRRHQHRGGFAGRRRHFRIARRGHDRGQRTHPLRKRDRDFLRDHAAHRGADQMRRLDAERIHQPDRVFGHVAQFIGGLDRDFQEAQLEQFDRPQAACRRSAWSICRYRGCRSG